MPQRKIVPFASLFHIIHIVLPALKSCLNAEDGGEK